MQGASLNVTVYEGDVGSASLQQNRYESPTQPDAQGRHIDWWRYVIVPLLVAIIAALGAVLVAVLKGWIG